MKKVHLLATVVLVAAPLSANAATVTISLTDTDDIIIPVFDPSLGTLTRVDLDLTLRGGTTTTGGFPSFPSAIIASDSRSGSGIPFQSQTVTFDIEPTTHDAQTQSYTDGGFIKLGRFDLELTAESQVHTGRITYLGKSRVGFDEYEAIARFDPDDPPALHSHSYGAISRSLVCAGAGLSPFLGPSNVIIAAGASGVASASPPDITIRGFSAGGWDFSPTTIPTSLGHAHGIDPRFDVAATFYFEEALSPVPEPSAITLFGVSAMGLVMFRRRRKR